MTFTLNSISNKNNVKSIVYEIPLYRVTILYVIFQVLCSGIFIIISLSVDVPDWVPMVISTVILCLFVIGFILNDSAKQVVISQEEVYKNKINGLATLQSMTKVLMENCENSAVKRQLCNLYEELRYSDPVSNWKITDKENEIREEMVVLKHFIGKEPERVEDQIVYIHSLLVERNELCKILK